jgi:hypothetical protein
MNGHPQVKAICREQQQRLRRYRTAWKWLFWSFVVAVAAPIVGPLIGTLLIATYSLATVLAVRHYREHFRKGGSSHALFVNRVPYEFLQTGYAATPTATTSIRSLNYTPPHLLGAVCKMQSNPACHYLSGLQSPHHPARHKFYQRSCVASRLPAGRAGRPFPETHC